MKYWSFCSLLTFDETKNFSHSFICINSYKATTSSWKAFKNQLTWNVSGGTVLANISNRDLSLSAFAVEAGEIWGIRKSLKRFATWKHKGKCNGLLSFLLTLSSNNGSFLESFQIQNICIWRKTLQIRATSEYFNTATGLNY